MAPQTPILQRSEQGLQVGCATGDSSVFSFEACDDGLGRVTFTSDMAIVTRTLQPGQEEQLLLLAQSGDQNTKISFEATPENQVTLQCYWDYRGFVFSFFQEQYNPLKTIRTVILNKPAASELLQLLAARRLQRIDRSRLGPPTFGL